MIDNNKVLLGERKLKDYMITECCAKTKVKKARGISKTDDDVSDKDVMREYTRVFNK